jgi:peptidyl-prolyl cis-trans isomerase C
MDVRKICGICLAIIVFAAGADGQQSASVPQAETGGAPPAASQAPAPSAPADASADKVVLKIGSDQVTEAELNGIISKLDSKAKAVIARKGRRPVADEYVRTYLLSRAAVEQHLDQSPSVREELQLQRDQILAQAEYDKITRANPVSEEEISQYYAAHREEFETVQTQEILLRKKIADPNNKDSWQGMPAEKAKVTAEAFRKALLKGKDPAEVSAGYPVSSGVLLIDQKPRTSRRADMQPFMAQAVFDVSAPGVTEVLETPQAFIVVKVFSHQKPELKDVTGQIRVKLQRQKLDAEVEAMKKKAGVWMDEDYFKEPPAKSTEEAGAAPSKPHTEP